MFPVDYSDKCHQPTIGNASYLIDQGLEHCIYLTLLPTKSFPAGRILSSKDSGETVAS